MTVEEIEKKIEELKQKKKEELEKQQKKEAKKRKDLNARKRKLQSRVKYIVGGYVLSKDSEYVQRLVSDKSAEFREADLESLQRYLELKKAKN